MPQLIASYSLLRNCLDLGLLETVLPDEGVRGDTILTEVNEDVPSTAINSGSKTQRIEGYSLAIGVVALTDHEVVVVVVGAEGLEGTGGSGLPCGVLLLGLDGDEVLLEALEVSCTNLSQ